LGIPKPKEKTTISSNDSDILTSRLQVVLTKKRDFQNNEETNWTRHTHRETHTSTPRVVNPTKFITNVSKPQALKG